MFLASVLDRLFNGPSATTNEPEVGIEEIKTESDNEEGKYSKEEDLWEQIGLVDSYEHAKMKDRDEQMTETATDDTESESMSRNEKIMEGEEEEVENPQVQQEIDTREEETKGITEIDGAEPEMKSDQREREVEENENGEEKETQWRTRTDQEETKAEREESEVVGQEQEIQVDVEHKTVDQSLQINTSSHDQAQKLYNIENREDKEIESFHVMADYPESTQKDQMVQNGQRTVDASVSAISTVSEGNDMKTESPKSLKLSEGVIDDEIVAASEWESKSVSDRAKAYMKYVNKPEYSIPEEPTQREHHRRHHRHRSHPTRRTESQEAIREPYHRRHRTRSDKGRMRSRGRRQKARDEETWGKKAGAAEERTQLEAEGQMQVDVFAEVPKEMPESYEQNQQSSDQPTELKENKE